MNANAAASYFQLNLHEETDNLRIDPGPLGESLKRFSDQTGIALIYDHRIVAGHRAPAVEGPLTPLKALERLLVHSGLEFRIISDHTVAVIKPASPAEDAAPLLVGASRPNENMHDEIIVLASYRSPGPTAGARILYALEGVDLQLAGAQNVAEPILDLPTSVASVTSANTALFVSAGGLNLADLRGLSAERSIVLVNGRRFIRTSGGNGPIYGVDLNAIPTPFVKRIEIINQGAGAALGGDAVAGAINIVTRDEIDGVAVSANGGLSERGDASEYSASIFAGKSFAHDRAHIAAGLAYAADPSLLLQDRPRLSSPFGFGLDGRIASSDDGVFAAGFGGSSITPAGNVAGAITQSGAVRFLFAGEQLALSPDGDGFEPFVGKLDQLFNWTQNFSALPEIDRFHGYLTGGFELSDKHHVYTEFYYSLIDTHTQIAAEPATAFRGRSLQTGDAIVVSAGHPNAPPGLADAVSNLIGEPVSQFLINRRYVELGPRERRIERENIQFVGGVNGEFSDDWSYDLTYQFGRNETGDVATGRVEASRVATAVDPEACAAAPGCLDVNIFAFNSITQQQSAFYRAANRKRVIKTTEHIVRAAATGAIYSVGERDGVIAVGGEYRRDRLDNRSAADLSDEAVLGEFKFPTANGHVSYADIFAHADLPIIARRSGNPIVEFGAEARVTRWSPQNAASDYVANFSGDISITPTRGLEIYAQFLHGGRAPNVVELFSTGADTASLFFDPCGELEFAEDVVIDNCTTQGPLGVSPGFTQIKPLVQEMATGNPALERERVKTRHFGLAADIHRMTELGGRRLRLSADWRRHQIRDAILGSSGAMSVSECYSSAGLASAFCGVNPATGNLFIQRDPTTSQLLRVEATFLNGNFIHASGLDANLKYSSDLDWAPFSPTLTLDLLYTYTHRMRLAALAGQEASRADGLADFPRHQIYSSASLEAGRFKTTWSVRRRGKAQTILNTGVPEANIPAVTYVDMGVQFRPNSHVIAFAGIENLFDAAFPLVAFAEHGFLTEHYDPIGRRFFAGVKAEF